MPEKEIEEKKEPREPEPRERKFSWTKLLFILAALATILTAVFAIYDRTRTRSVPQEPTSIALKRPEPALEEIEEQKEEEVSPAKRPETDEKEEGLIELKKLINSSVFASIPSHSDKLNVALVVVSKSTKTGFSPENVLYNLLGTENVNIVLNLFKEKQFIKNGLFTQIYDGNTDLLKHTGVLSQIQYVVLGKLNYSFEKRTSLDSDLISCDINLSYKIINENGVVVETDSITALGSGFSEDQALKRGVEQLSEQHSARIFGVILRRG